MSSRKSQFRVLSSLFFMWGFITVMNDVLINTFKGIFDLSAPQRALIQFAFFGAFFIVSLLYFLISSSSGQDPINKLGYKRGMVLSLVVCGLGCALFYPAAELNSYNAFLFALFTLASGVTLLQICANPYATILGPPQSASSRLNLAQGLNSLGTTIGPLVGTIFIYKIFSDGELTVHGIANTYLIYALFFILLSVILSFSKLPAFRNAQKIEKGFSVLKNRHLSLGVIAIALYVGSEVAVGSWIVEFIKEEDIKGLDEVRASYFLSFFWGGLMIGRLMAAVSLNNELRSGQKYLRMLLYSMLALFVIYVGTGLKYDQGAFSLQLLPIKSILPYVLLIVLCYLSFVFTFNKPAKALAVFAGINTLLLGIGIMFKGDIAFWAVIGSGLFFSVGWTNIFSLAIKDLGHLTSQGSSLLVMAVVGGAILPGLQSFVIESHSVQVSFIIPLLGMLYLVFYGLYGHRHSLRAETTRS